MELDFGTLVLFGGMAIVVAGFFVPLLFDEFKTIKKAIEKYGKEGLQKRIMIFGGCMMAVAFVLMLASVYRPYNGKSEAEKLIDSMVESQMKDIYGN